MAAKKEPAIELSPEEQSQVQNLFAQYHQIAEKLRQSRNQDEARSALAEITSQPDGVQVALLKRLARERETDAADILAALHALVSQKELRKEARRALLRLEGTKVRASWQVPTEPSVLVPAVGELAPRFWKGLVTEAREQGELQLLLCWELGSSSNEIRVLSFLLDFWHEGVKDATHDLLPRRRVEERFAQWRSEAANNEINVVDCTLAEGKRLIEDALAVGEARGKAPSDGYRAVQSLVNTLILQATDLGKDRGRTFIAPEMEAEEVVLNFIGAWSFGDFGLAYDLLTADSDLRAGQDRAEWIAAHRAWHQEAHPVRLELGFIREREATQSAIWLPGSARAGLPTRKEVEMGWSLELNSTPLSGTLPEMPMGTAVNKETGRHWFSTSYSLIREDGAWRIKSAKDEGVALQGLPPGELQTRIKELQQIIEERTEQRETVEPQRFLEEMAWRLSQLLHTCDALIAQLPLDRGAVEQAYSIAVFTGNSERMLVYLDRLIQRFPEKKLEYMRRYAATLVGLAQNYDQTKMQERVQYVLGRAEEILHDLIAQEDTAINHALYAEFLLSEFRNDDAEKEFRLALERNPDQEYQTSIEVGLGHIAMRREQPGDAVAHYRRVSELNPNYPGVWFSLGFAHRMLGQLDEAEKCYQRAIQVDVHDPRPYTDLAAIYLNTQRKLEARITLEQAVQNNPESAHLHAILASMLLEVGEPQAARRELEVAERLDPEHETVQQVRQHMQTVMK